MEYYHPIIFDKPPQHLYCPVYFDPSPEAEETDSIIPSFCTAGLEQSVLPTDCVPEPIPVSPLAVPTASGASLPFSPKEQTATTPPVPVIPHQGRPDISTKPQQTAKSYAVAQELLLKVPLRLVDEVLYAFDGTVYRFVSQPVMYRLIMAHCRPAIAESGGAALIRQVHDLIRAEPNIVLPCNEASLPYVALDNGLLNLNSGQLLPPDPSLFVTARIRGHFLPETTEFSCPCFDHFLANIAGGDLLLVQRIWEVIGYCLVPDMSGKCFFLFQGVPDSGKSLLGELIASCFEREDVTSLDITALGQQFGPSELVGKRLCLSMDLAAIPWDTKAIGILKQLTGNDLISADVKYQPRIRFRNTAAFLFACNHAVTSMTRDEAFFQRLVTVPFRYAVPKARQDREFLQRLVPEKDAIITRAIHAYWELRRNNYVFTGDYRVNEVVSQEYGSEVICLDQSVADFFYRRCVLDPEALTFCEDLYEEFRQQCPGSFDQASFSTHFCAFLERVSLGQVRKIRKRKAGAKNPISAFSGLRLATIQEKGE